MRKIYTDNIRVEFNIVIDEITISPETVLNRPIIKENNAIGAITEAVLDDSGLFIKCKGIIWDKFIRVSVMKNEREEFSFNSIEI